MYIKDARALADSGQHQTREKKRSVGYGKNKTTVMDRWDVAGLRGLTSAGFYGESGSGSHENRLGFIPNPLNVVVVIHDPHKEHNPQSDTMVILTNSSVDVPLKVYDAYDDRSTIENSLFREARQSRLIERPARNTASAFRTWMDSRDDLESQGEETGIRKFREKVRQENGNKLIIFDEDRYAIFETYEIFILCGRNVLKPGGITETITKEDILHKYGVLLE